MKKILTLAVLFSPAMMCLAQSSQQNAIKFNPVSVIVKTGNISYEKAIAANQSVQLGGFFSGLSLDQFSYRGFGITPEYRYYFGGRKEVFNGGYLAPFTRYQQFSVSEKSSNTKGKFQTLGGGMTLGWEHRSASGFVFDIFAGPSYNKIRFKSGDEDDFDISSSIGGFGLRTGISLGFTF